MTLVACRWPNGLDLLIRREPHAKSTQFHLNGPVGADPRGIDISQFNTLNPTRMPSAADARRMHEQLVEHMFKLGATKDDPMEEGPHYVVNNVPDSFWNEYVAQNSWNHLFQQRVIFEIPAPEPPPTVSARRR